MEMSRNCIIPTLHRFNCLRGKSAIGGIELNVAIVAAFNVFLSFAALPTWLDHPWIHNI